MVRAPDGTRVYLGTVRIIAPESLIEVTRTEIIKHPGELVVPMSERAWVLFGDESTAQGVVTYGLVGFERPSHANSATFAFEREIRRAGAPPGSRVHSRELFSGDARKKTGWAHLKTEEQTWEVAESLIEALRHHHARFFLGVVYKDTFTKHNPAGRGATVPLKNEHCYAFGFIASSSAFGVGADVREQERVRYALFIDNQDAKATFWGLGHLQIRRMMKATGLEPLPRGEGEHLLLDAADLFAYAAARAMSEASSRNKATCERILSLSRPVTGHYWWQAPTDEISPKMKQRLGLQA